MNLAHVAEEIQHRIIHIFGRDMTGRRATNGGNDTLDFNPHFRDYVHFYEVSEGSLTTSECPNFRKFFHGDDGKGLGASHQTGWYYFLSCFHRLVIHLIKGLVWSHFT